MPTTESSVCLTSEKAPAPSSVGMPMRSSSVSLKNFSEGKSRVRSRSPAGADTHEVESNISAPKTVRIEKRGDFFYAFVSGEDGKLRPAGAATKLPLTGEFYVGIGVCAHDKDVIEKAGSLYRSPD